jgi:hypothetical protein
MTNIVDRLAEDCFTAVYRASSETQRGSFLSMRRAVEIARSVLMQGGGPLVEEALPMFPWIEKDELPNALLKACVAEIVELMSPLLGSIVAQRFCDLNASNLVRLVDEIIDSIAAILRNEYIGLSSSRFHSILRDMKRVNIWSERVFEGSERNEVRLLGVSMQNLHRDLTSHERIGLNNRMIDHTDLLLAVSLFCVSVGSEEYNLADDAAVKKKQRRSKPKYTRLENYADVRRWFEAR